MGRHDELRVCSVEMSPRHLQQTSLRVSVAVGAFRFWYVLRRCLARLSAFRCAREELFVSRSRLQSQVRSVSAKLRADFEAVAPVVRERTKEHCREVFARGFLRQYLPRRFAIGSGIAIDSTGRDSGRIDIAVVDG